MTDQYYTCICGKVHLKSQPIRCSGLGHSVYINPSYFKYDVHAVKEQPKEKSQLKIF